jgi:Xaa-Pro aminopeptidase
VSDVFAARRARVLDALGDRGALVVAAAPEPRTSGDGELRGVPDTAVWYLTGYTEPDAVVVLCPGADAPFTLFVRPHDAEQERWSGRRGGEAAAREEFGADAAHPLHEIGATLPKLLRGADVLHAALESGRAEVDGAMHAALREARRQRPRSGRGVHTIVDPARTLGPLRRVKDADEVARLREAADVAVHGFRAAARAVRDAAGEWDVEAALEHALRRGGASGPAFPSIVAAGENATVLHYRDNSAPFVPGTVLLFDAGARRRMYCSDITRVFPVGGRFTGAQRELYDVVLAAHAAALAAIAPGAPFSAVDDAALAVLIDGMKQVGLLHGETDGIIERKEYRRYFPHRTSHWLGLDVHDAGDYVHDDGSPVTLGDGMVLTVEPGLYVPADDADAPAALRATGIRLEDDVLVTATGRDVLTRALPIAATDVEQLMEEDA